MHKIIEWIYSLINSNSDSYSRRDIMNDVKEKPDGIISAGDSLLTVVQELSNRIDVLKENVQELSNRIDNLPNRVAKENSQMNIMEGETHNFQGTLRGFEEGLKEVVGKYHKYHYNKISETTHADLYDELLGLFIQNTQYKLIEYDKKTSIFFDVVESKHVNQRIENPALVIQKPDGAVQCIQKGRVTEPVNTNQ